MTDARLPYWLGASDRDELAQACRSAVEGPARGTHDAAVLRDVLTELSVAGARDDAWPAGNALRRAAGWDDDVLPVRMAPAETDAVLRHLPPGRLKALLAPAQEDA